MAIKSAWAYRNGLRMDKKNRELLERLRKEEAFDKQTRVLAFQKERIIKEVETLKDNTKKLENLVVGQWLKDWGLNIVVAKMNKKSIIDTCGEKWTHEELLNEFI